MQRRILTIFVILIMIGSLIVFIPNVSASHNLAVTCIPTEKDITDNNTWKVKYEIDLKLTPGCSNQYWVAFTLASPPARFHRKLYEKGDPLETSISAPSAPPDANYNNWAYWISAGSGSEVHFYAILEVWCDAGTLNDQQATITVDCYSCDNYPNDLERKVITTITTVNIPNGIQMFHAVPFKATQWVEPYEWAEYDIVIKDIDEGYGSINLSKDPMSSAELDTTWDWEFSANPVNLPKSGTIGFKLKVRPPQDVADGSFTRFIVKSVNLNNNSKNHRVLAKTIVSKPKPDLSVRVDSGFDNIKLLGNNYSAGNNYNISIDIYNLGEIAVSNFNVSFRLLTIGMEALIGIVTIIDTVDSNERINVQYPWTAIEGSHSLCVRLDEENLIPEMDEDSNNEAGIIVEVGPAIPGSIILNLSIDKEKCMPDTEFTVSGTAKYNPEYGSLPVIDADVKVKIKETSTIFTGKTNNKGECSVTCTAPSKTADYTIEVSINDGTISAKKNSYLTVASFKVIAQVSPDTILSGESATISGKVTESNFIVSDVNVTINLFDKDDNIKDSVTTKTDIMGFYSKKTNAITVTDYSKLKIEVTATKDEITGIQESILIIDIDTDSDLIGNMVDTDDDGDNYPDNIEEPYGYDSLDPTSVPYPVADAGSNQTVNEGSVVSFDGGGSYSPVGLELNYLWDFGDSIGTSIIQAPTYVYDENNEYIAILIVTDQYDGNDSSSVKIIVVDLGPTAKLSGPTTGEQNSELTFSALDSTTIIDKIVKYEWDWTGDGIFEETSEVTARHSWSEAGTYTITLRVTDEDGSINITTLDVFISPIDSDNDGYPDYIDKFPNDINEWNDTDGDGYGDNSDKFPNDINEWNDTDNDGVGDNSDVYPSDPTKWKKESSEKGMGIDSYWLWILVIIVIVVILLILLFIIKSKKTNKDIEQFEKEETEIKTYIEKPREYSPVQENLCSICGQQKTYIQQNNRYYCYYCQRYE